MNKPHMTAAQVSAARLQEQIRQQLSAPKVLPGYESLAGVLQRALDQAQAGKGAERHACGDPFDKQPMQTISQLVGSADGLLYQAIKKAQ